MEVPEREARMILSATVTLATPHACADAAAELASGSATVLGVEVGDCPALREALEALLSYGASFEVVAVNAGAAARN